METTLKLVIKRKKGVPALHRSDLAIGHFLNGVRPEPSYARLCSVGVYFGSHRYDDVTLIETIQTKPYVIYFVDPVQLLYGSLFSEIRGAQRLPRYLNSLTTKRAYN